MGAVFSYWSGGDPSCLRAAKPPSQSVKPADLERPLCDKEGPCTTDRSPVGGDEDPVQPETSE